MVVLILFSFGAIFFFYLWGKIIEGIWPVIGNGFFFTLLNGIIAVSLIAYFSAFFMALNRYFEYLIIGIALFYYFFQHRKIHQQFINFSFYKSPTFWIFSFIAVLSSSIMPFLVDHFSYYIPTIKWLNEFGFVRGISNLEWVLAQNSIWHVLEASINHLLNPFLRLNLVLLIAFLIYIYENKQWVLLLFFPFFLIYTHSPSTDLPVYILSLIIVSELLLKRIKPEYLQAYVFLSLYIFVIKPTAIALPLFIVLLILHSMQQNPFKINYPSFMLSGFLLVLFIMKSIIVSANLLHPLSLLSLDFLSWSSPKELYQKSELYGLLNSFDMKYTIQEINTFSLVDKFLNWLLIDGYAKFIHIGTVILLMVSMLFSFIKKRKMYMILILILFLKCLIIFFQSAQYRFMLDAVLILVFLLLNELKMTSKNFKKIGMTLSILIVFSIFKPFILQKYVPSFHVGHYMANYNLKQLIIPQIYSHNLYHKHQVGNLKFNVPHKQAFMFNMTLPAITYQQLGNFYALKGFPQLYNPNIIKKGFYWKKLTAHELNQLKVIMEQESQFE